MGNGTKFGVMLGAMLSVVATATLAGATPSENPTSSGRRETSARAQAGASEKSTSPALQGRRRGGTTSRDEGARSAAKNGSRAVKDERSARADSTTSNDERKTAKDSGSARAAKSDGAAKDERAKRGAPKEKPGISGEVEGGNHPPRPRRAPSPAAPAVAPKPPCVRDAIHFERGFGGDAESIVLTRCDGRPNATAIDQLSILVRPMSAARPSPLASRIRRASHREWLPGVKRIHEGLVTRLQQVVDRFRAQRVTLVSGYRPTSLGSFHQSARALDLHVEGVRNESLVEFCRTLPDTGCGYYPNSSFVHIDVRPAGTGHVYWIDASGPGEPARYVASWPPKETAQVTSGIAPPDPAAPLDEQTHPGASGRPPLGGDDAKIDARTTAPWLGGDGLDSPFSP